MRKISDLKFYKEGADIRICHPKLTWRDVVLNEKDVRRVLSYVYSKNVSIDAKDGKIHIVGKFAFLEDRDLDCSVREYTEDLIAGLKKILVK